jgi:hypothetical protein
MAVKVLLGKAKKAAYTLFTCFHYFCALFTMRKRSIQLNPAACVGIMPQREATKIQITRDVTLRAKRKYLVLNGNFSFKLKMSKALHHWSSDADITFNGKNVGSVIRKPNQDVPGNQSARVPFYFEKLQIKERVGICMSE